MLPDVVRRQRRTPGPVGSLRKGTVTLKASTDVIDGERVTDTPKSGRSRTIAIDPQTVALLGEHRRQQDEQRDRLGAAHMDAGDYVFTREDGQQLYPSTVTQLMSRFIRDYNEPHQPGRRGHPREALPPPEILLPPARLHDLRHLHATTLLRAGEAVHVVSNRLGHADPAITLRVYAHVINESSPLPAMAFAEAVARLDHEDDADDADRDE